VVTTLRSLVERAEHDVRHARRQSESAVQAAEAALRRAERRRDEGNRVAAEALSVMRTEMRAATPENRAALAKEMSAAGRRNAQAQTAGNADVEDAQERLEQARKRQAETVADAAAVLAQWRFEQALEDWLTACQREEPPVDVDVTAPMPQLQRSYGDPVLWALADGDEYLAAAYHLRAAGIPIPKGWRSPVTGVTPHVPAHAPDSTS
jgi:hypothetical protein